jgi:solute carrier family 25 iron transporter 28/37
MNVPFTAVHLTVYESAKKTMSGHEEESLAVQLLAGGLAGATAAAITNPLDMVKTRLQLEGVNSATRYGTTAVVRRLV